MYTCRPVGFDIGKGVRVLAAGDRLGPSELGLLAAVGVTRVSALHTHTHILMQTEVYDQSECNVHTHPGTHTSWCRLKCMTRVSVMYTHILVQTEVYDQSECNVHTHPGAD